MFTWSVYVMTEVSASSPMQAPRASSPIYDWSMVFTTEDDDDDEKDLDEKEDEEEEEDEVCCGHTYETTFFYLDTTEI